MKKVATIAGYTFVALSSLSLAYVSLLAWADPKAVMALVQVELNNNDALSSIRGVYGGVGISLVTLVVIMAIKNLKNSLLFLGGFWLMYALSRLITLSKDGPLGDFGNNWLKIELFFGITAFAIYFLYQSALRKASQATKTSASIAFQKTAH